MPKVDRESEEKEVNRSGRGDGGPTDLHPFIQGLLKELPPAGGVWPDAKRKLWLDTAASIFKVIYKDGHDNLDDQMTRPPTEAAPVGTRVNLSPQIPGSRPVV
jgi:hypothetical protein